MMSRATNMLFAMTDRRKRVALLTLLTFVAMC
jgi:hypothetical protein